MDDGFSPADHFDRLIKYWWVIFLCMIFGAGLGWLAHKSKPPIYEAKSTISTAINFDETGFMTDTEEDHALSGVGEVILSDAVVADLQSLLAEGTLASLGGNLRKNLFAEREGYRWTLRVQAASPEVAAGVSAAWAKAAMNKLNDSLSHAQRALIVSRQISALQTCLSESVSLLPSVVPCELPDSAELQAKLVDLGSQYRNERSLSNGVISALTFALTQSGTSSGRPATYQTAGMVLAGALLGFIAGVILIIARIPDKIFKASLSDK